MHILHRTHHFPAESRGAVMALGNFDGIHLGHQAILQHVRALAAEAGAPSAVMTFEPHPITVLRPKVAPSLLRLTSLRTKMRLLEDADMSHVVVVPFTREFAETSAENFVDNFLVGQLGIRHLVIGHDFIFGKNRTGNSALLKQKAEKWGFGLTQIAPVLKGGEICSSTAVREYVRKGEVEKAEALLGRPYFLEGKVVEGDKRGRLLGIPTANIRLHQLLPPLFGVYTAEVVIAGETKPRKAIVNIGKKPTFGGNEPLLEAHLLEYSGDLYHKRIRVFLRHFMREEQKFAGISALTQQLTEDIAYARDWHRKTGKA